MKINKILTGLVLIWIIGSVSAVSEEDPVAYWSFDDISGNSVYDGAGNNDGTIYGAEIVDGILGDALYFDGKEDYIEVYADDSLDLTGEITVEAWIKRGDWSSNWSAIISKTYYSDKWENPWVQYKLSRYVDTDELCFQFATSNSEFATLFGGSNIPQGEWVHVVVTYDRSNLKMYINGKLDTSMIESGSLQSRNTHVFIGRNWDSGYQNEFFNGTIDEISIYNIALTAYEIEERYKALKCTIGETKSCNASKNCAGTQTCVGGFWGSCLKDDTCCGVGCVSGDDCCPSGCSGSDSDCGCINGQTRSCVAENGCMGSQICTNGQWDKCITSKIKINLDKIRSFIPPGYTETIELPLSVEDGVEMKNINIKVSGEVEKWFTCEQIDVSDNTVRSIFVEVPDDITHGRTYHGYLRMGCSPDDIPIEIKVISPIVVLKSNSVEFDPENPTPIGISGAVQNLDTDVLEDIVVTLTITSGAKIISAKGATDAIGPLVTSWSYNDLKRGEVESISLTLEITDPSTDKVGYEMLVGYKNPMTGEAIYGSKTDYITIIKESPKPNGTDTICGDGICDVGEVGDKDYQEKDKEWRPDPLFIIAIALIIVIVVGIWRSGVILKE